MRHFGYDEREFSYDPLKEKKKKKKKGLSLKK